VISNKDLRLVVGVALIAVAMLIPNISALAVNDFNPPELMSPSITGTFDEPQNIDSGKDMLLSIEARDVESGIDYAWVNVRGDNDYSLSRELIAESVPVTLDEWTTYSRTWSVPSDVGVKYAITWTAYDNGANSKGMFTYAYTSQITPDIPVGHFVINGTEIDRDGMFFMSRAGIEIGFVAEANLDMIKEEKVTFTRGTTAEVLVLPKPSALNEEVKVDYTFKTDQQWVLSGVIVATDNIEYERMNNVYVEVSYDPLITITTSTTTTTTECDEGFTLIDGVCVENDFTPKSFLEKYWVSMIFAISGIAVVMTSFWEPKVGRA